MFRIAPILGDFRPVRTDVNLTHNTWTQLCGVNVDRAILYISNATNLTFIVLSPDQAGATATSGWQLTQGNYLRFTWEQDGPMSTLAWWYFWGSASAATITTYEWIWQPIVRGS